MIVAGLIIAGEVVKNLAGNNGKNWQNVLTKKTSKPIINLNDWQMIKDIWVYKMIKI